MSVACPRELARAAFDGLAPVYDARYSAAQNGVMGWLRRENLALLRALFPPGSTLLEIGCGTGEEAVALAGMGHTVWATDLSPRMAAQTAARALAAGVGHRVHPLVVAAGDLQALDAPGKFDGAWASFGALNCEPRLQAWRDALADLLRPGAPLICSVLNRWCLWEMLWFALHGRPQDALRRRGPGWHLAAVSTAQGTMQVPVRYPRLGEWLHLLRPRFTVERVMAWPLLLPPPYLDELYRRWQGLFTRLEGVERLLRGRRPWRSWGDHLLLVARRRDG